MSFAFFNDFILEHTDISFIKTPYKYGKKISFYLSNIVCTFYYHKILIIVKKKYLSIYYFAVMSASAKIIGKSYHVFYGTLLLTELSLYRKLKV